jgi:peptidoglycan/xylan/chitin deacetylase (PgdA/CDA1 family)
MSMSRFRVDRTVTLGLAHPAHRAFGNSHSCRIPVLMYHGVNSVIGSAHPYFETSTSPIVFARHMQHLHEGGYKPIDLGTAVRMINSGTCPQRSVVITFDDGFRDFYTHAMPILREHRFPATMFVVSSLMGSRTARFDGKEIMTWGEMREIESFGVEIGSHTVSHPHLHSLHWKDIERELTHSKEAIEDQLGRPISSFSYPYAFPEQDGTFLRQLRQSMEAAGYDHGVTTVLGSVNLLSDRYFLPRLPANEYDDDGLFQAKLEGSYDWLHTPQLIYKVVRNRKRTIGTLPQEREQKSKLATER